MEHYYITFTCFHGKAGQTLLRQMDAGEDGFNLAGAHRHIAELLKEPIMILSWQKISEKRYLEFSQYISKAAEDLSGGKKAPILKLHPGGKESESPSGDPDPSNDQK